MYSTMGKHEIALHYIMKANLILENNFKIFINNYE
jgi:hypothetical protein